MNPTRNIPSVFQGDERSWLVEGKFTKLYEQLQTQISTFYSENKLAATGTYSDKSTKTVFGFEAEFAQSVFGRETGQVLLSKALQNPATKVLLDKKLGEEKLTLQEWEYKVASLENLFHMDIEKSPFYEKGTEVKGKIGGWELGTDYFDVLELATPGLQYDPVWENVNSNFPKLKGTGAWKEMKDIGRVWEKALWIATSERVYKALEKQDFPELEQDTAKNSKPFWEKSKTVDMVLKLLRGDKSASEKSLQQGLVTSWLAQNKDGELTLEPKHFTLHPNELPNCICDTPPKVKRKNLYTALIQRNFVKNGLRLIAPQYNITVPATCALALVERGVNLEASFESKYLDALNNLHLGFRKYLTAKCNPQTDIARYAVTLLAYYLTNICGLPSQIRGDLRTQTKFDVCTELKRKQAYQEKIKEIDKAWKDYETKAYCYTHSWIKDVAHTWIKANGVTSFQAVLNCFNDVDKLAFNNVFKQALLAMAPDDDNDLQHLQNNLSSGDISTPLLKVAGLMDYDFEDRKFVRFVFNSERLDQLVGGPIKRQEIFQRYKPGLFEPANPDKPKAEFQPEQYFQSGLEQCTWAINNVVRCFKYHCYTEYNAVSKGVKITQQVIDNFKAYKEITWCREDTYKVYQDNLYKENDKLQGKNNVLVTEVRDQEFLDKLCDDRNYNEKGG